jgi:hypothetical protein
MVVKAALAFLIALSTSTSMAHAADAGDGFLYRYTKTVFKTAGGGTTNPTDPTDPTDPEDPGEPEPPEEACGTYTIGGGYSVGGQALDANGDCVFTSPTYAGRAIGFDYTTAENFCSSQMKGGGRIAKIDKAAGLGRRSIKNGNASIISSAFNMPGISSITCSIVPSTCGTGNFQDGASCLPVTNLSCGRLKNDLNHYIPYGPDNVEMASIGQCTFQLPQVTIDFGGTSIMGEGPTMQKWVSTLKSGGYNDFDGFISSYQLSPSTSYDYAYWKSSSTVPTIPRLPYKAVDEMTISDTGYGTAATLPPALVATPIDQSGVPMAATTSITIKFTPEAAANGVSSVADIAVYDLAGGEVEATSVVKNAYNNQVGSNELVDYNASTVINFDSNYESAAQQVTLTFPANTVVGSIALRAASSSNALFPKAVKVYSDAQAANELFHAGTRPYVESQKVNAGEWTRILNPAYF